MRPNFPKLCLATVIASSVLALSGCNDSDNDQTTVTPPSTSGDVVLAKDQVAIYYKRDNATTLADYEGWGLDLWDAGGPDVLKKPDTQWDKPMMPTGVDAEKGAYFVIDLTKDRDPAQRFNFIAHKGEEKNCQDDLAYSVDAYGKDAYTVQGSCEIRDSFDAGLSLESNQVAIYYKRKDGDEANWGLHLWGDDGVLAEGVATDYNKPKMPDGVDEEKGAYYIINLAADRTNQNFNFITHKFVGEEDQKDCGDRVYSVTDNGKDGYTMQGTCEVSNDPIPATLLENSAAHFIDGTHLVWNAPEGAASVELVYAPNGGIKDNGDITDLEGVGLEYITLTDDGLLPTGDLLASPYPAFFGMQQWALPDNAFLEDVKELLKGQLVLLAKDADGMGLSATRVQTGFALDSLYFDNTDLNEQQLGASYSGDKIDIKLWAPTAKKVTLQTATSGEVDAATINHVMNFDNVTGLWTFTGDKETFDRKFYRYEIEVYRRDTDEVSTVVVTDPYSLNVSSNGAFTQIVNLNDADTQPDGWDKIAVNDDERPNNIVVYETHIRDISNSDTAKDGVDLKNNGKYKAFAESDRASMTHLQNLAKHGLTYVQVLPAFDIATVNENPEEVANLGDQFSKLCELNPEIKNNADFSGHCGGAETIGQVFDRIKDDDEKPQALNNYLRAHDSFNWGYDPFHYTVPEGSYASNTSGIARIKEFREMVVALNGMGLKVAMDVVYNHTNAAGTAPKSVLDKIVPDYYQRLDINTGAVENSSCCSNTASEQKMMAKLMEDSLKVWTKDYKVDAFRFDLMGLHLKKNMTDIQAHLKQVNKGMYLYGEGWTMGFGGGAGHSDTAATQLNMADTGIGTFSDRLRDAVRGGGPFDGGEGIRKTQGFGSGAWGVRNELNTETDEDGLKNSMDLIRVGLAGNLADYKFTNYKGKPVKGSEVIYNGAPGGYTKQPMENVGYVSKHDNQTLWDNNQYKLAEGLTATERTKMQILAQALPILSQGVPFIHMGAELLRSKSMQRDSYDSGDWFNRVNFDLTDSSWNNNWNVGLPRADKDAANWDLIRKINANEQIAPTSEDAQLSSAMMMEYLAIRQASPLFQLQTAEEVQKVVKFHNTGVDQEGGVIVMELDNSASTVAGDYQHIMVVINATAEVLDYAVVPNGEGYRLHPEHKHFAKESAYSVAVTEGNVFTVPARSVAVFVKGENTLTTTK